jgi:hypothetical protein
MTTAAIELRVTCFAEDAGGYVISLGGSPAAGPMDARHDSN